MRLVVISSCAPVDAYVIERVRREWPVQLVVRPVDDLWSRLKRATAAKLLRQVRSGFNQVYARGLERRIGHLLFDGAPPVIECVTVPMTRMSEPENLDRIRGVAPDLMIVSGGPLLKPEAFNLPVLGTVNLHWGIAPEYRGNNTLFWPMYLRDHDHLGVTLHYVDSGIDTGRVLARGYPALQPDDGEAEVWASSARVSAELVLKLLSALEQGRRPRGMVQTCPGRLYRNHDRTIWASVSYAVRRRLWRERLPERAAHLETFFLPSA